MKNIYIGLLVFILSVAWVWSDSSIEPLEEGQVFFPKQGLTLQVELAKTKKQRALGLMYRPSLALNKGMLFEFEQEAIQRVWMKSTLIQLDIIFLSEQKEIVSIIKNLQPCSQKECGVYSSKRKAKYMLEINAGMIMNNGIRIGQKVSF